MYNMLAMFSLIVKNLPMCWMSKVVFIIYMEVGE